MDPRSARVSLLALLALSGRLGAAEPTPAPDASEALTELTVSAPEPRYVAPTLRDRIGRIWAPVFINGKGPFRLVLDTGASRSAITASVARALGISLDAAPPVMLHAVTGSAVVPAVHVENMLIGDLEMDNATLPIVPDALGGAEGVLGTEGLTNKRIFIDFRHDRITIFRSHSQRARSGFVTVPLDVSNGKLLVRDAHVGSVKVQAIIDTGGQGTIANLPLQRILAQRHEDFTPTHVVGATDEVQPGMSSPMPTIRLGPLEIRGARVTSGDLAIFESWQLQQRPAMLIGMDTLGLFDTLIIDYRLRELQIELGSHG